MARTLGLRTVGLIALSAVAFSACGSGAEDPAAGDGRTAAVYQSILDWTLREEPPVALEGGDDPVLFVASRGEKQIDLDVQVAVVAALEDTIFVRFVDEQSEAIESDADNEPVRNDGMLVGLGAMAQEGDTVEVYTDLYRDLDDVKAWLVTLRRTGELWELVGSPVPAEVRPLPPGT